MRLAISLVFIFSHVLSSSQTEKKKNHFSHQIGGQVFIAAERNSNESLCGGCGELGLRYRANSWIYNIDFYSGPEYEMAGFPDYYTMHPQHLSIGLGRKRSTKYLGFSASIDLGIAWINRNRYETIPIVFIPLDFRTESVKFYRTYPYLDLSIEGDINYLGTGVGWRMTGSTNFQIVSLRVGVFLRLGVAWNRGTQNPAL